MRGYTFDPALLVLKSDEERLSGTEPSEKESVVSSEKRAASASERAPSVRLHSLETVPSGRVDGSTAWTIAVVLLLAIFVAALVDARSRLTRLETLLFAMLSHSKLT